MRHASSPHVKCQGFVYFFLSFQPPKDRCMKFYGKTVFTGRAEYLRDISDETEIKFLQFVTVACLMQPSAFCSVQWYKIKVRESSEMTAMTCALIGLKSSTATLSLKVYSAFYSFNFISGSLSVYARYHVSFPNNNNRSI